MELPVLDRVNSAALSRLANERGLQGGHAPAGEDRIPPPPRRWLRFLPPLFLLLSLASLAAMAFGVSAILEGGVGFADAVQLVLMLLLVVSVVSQSRSIIGRWLPGRSRRSSALEAPALHPSLDLVSAEDLLAAGPASLGAARRIARVARGTGRIAGRFAVVSVLVVAVLAFLAAAAILAWLLYAEGPADAAVWLTAPFTGLAGFAAWQLFANARAHGFRGSAGPLLTRGFRDSVRLWGSGSAVSRVALTTTATASVAGAAAAPAVLGPAAQWDLFVVDSASSAVYRIDLETMVSTRVSDGGGNLSPVAVGATQRRITLPDGTRLAADTLVAVVEGTGGSQRVVAIRPGASRPLLGPVLSAPLGDAAFTAGAGAVYALQAGGVLSRVDPATGAVAAIGNTGVSGPVTFDQASGDLVVLSGNSAVRVDPRTATVKTTTTIGPPGLAVCGIARGPGDRLLLAREGDTALLAVRLNTRETRVLQPTGELPGSMCLVTAVKR